MKDPPPFFPNAATDGVRDAAGILAALLRIERRLDALDRRQTSLEALVASAGSETRTVAKQVNQVRIAQNAFARHSARFSQLSRETKARVFAWIAAASVAKFRRLSREFATLIGSRAFADACLSCAALAARSQALKTIDTIETPLDALWWNHWPHNFAEAYAELALTNVEKIDLQVAVRRLPPCIDSLRALTFIKLRRCGLSGAPPQSLANIHTLTHLDLSENNLSGPFPEFISKLSNLQVLDLTWNNFDAGPIPDTFMCLFQLKEFYLESTNRTGPLPHWIAQMEHLECLYMSDNQLTGVIPSCFGNLKKLTQLFLNKNLLEGVFPIEMHALELKGFLVDLDKINGVPEHLATIAKGYE
ncbi:hypothetical protein BC830DRAFT_651266 [Chytriomyces sp. MP71]|nr:hypothetical protein BC830DRAFT_651266 [Chytriomyces sp. MP71]